MILSDNNLYGWGAGNIDLPRAAFDLHPDRPSTTGEIACQSKLGNAVCRWQTSNISRIFLDDYPWGQTILLGVISIFIIGYIIMLDGKLPTFQTESPARPVEIVVAMQTEEPPPPVMAKEPEPVVTKAPVPVQENVVIETVSRIPEKIVAEKPKEIKPALRKELPPEPKLPPVKIKQRAVPRKAPVPQHIAAAPPVIEKQTKPEVITITPPKVVTRTYTQKDTAKITPSDQMNKAVNLASARNPKHSADSPVQVAKKYARRDKEKNDDAPQLKTTANLYAQNQPANTGELTSLPNKITGRRYVSKTNALLPAVKAPPTGAKPQMEFTGAQSSGYQPPGKRHIFNKRDQRSSSVPQSVTRQLSFPSQKQENLTQLALPITDKLIVKTKQPAVQNTRAATPIHDFPDTVASAEIDPSELISLQAFNVCKDPEREFRQKTQLAAHFMKSTLIDVQGVVYFVRYTESGYTIQIHLYNPHGRQFKDRCEVLELAIDRITNRVN
jgi:hypothetical protein